MLHDSRFLILKEVVVYHLEMGMGSKPSLRLRSLHEVFWPGLGPVFSLLQRTQKNDILSQRASRARENH